MEFRKKTLRELAELICGNDTGATELQYFPYRSSSYLMEFFEEIDAPHVHDGSTRSWWVADVLAKILLEPSVSPNTPPETFARLIRRLMEQDEAFNEGPDRPTLSRS